MPPGVRDRKRSVASVVGVTILAVLAGIHIGSRISTRTVRYGVEFEFLNPGQETLNEAVVWYQEKAVPDPLQNAPSAPEKELQRVADMVAKTNGFYARDYSLGLGWNDMRYIIDTAILHGRILNRTTIIPSFVYARACEFDLTTCAAYATMVNRGDAVHSDNWRELPVEQQMAWRIPISLMFNLTHLQQSHAVITTEDYLRLHNIAADVESTDGQWNINTYHVQNATGDVFPSLHTVENGCYDPDEIIRVDYIPEDMRLRGGWSPEGGNSSRHQLGSWASPTTDSKIYKTLMEIVQKRSPVINWKDSRTLISPEERLQWTSSVEEIAGVLQKNGFELVYTYDNGYDGTESAKHVVLPSYEVVPRDRIRGLYEDFYNVSARVLLVRGEIPRERKPGSLYFTSTQSRARFTQAVLYDMRLRDDILTLAERISNRMFALTSGRLWMSAHMRRRGDFGTVHRTMQTNFSDHFAGIRMRLEHGREILSSMHGSNATVYDVPDAHPDSSLVILDPPRPDDMYYIATDERDPDNLQHLRDHGAVLISDLLTREDRREYGWPILLTDVLALIEQSIMSRSAYFYGHTSSSVAGGVMNLRAGLGMDPRTGLLDHF